MRIGRLELTVREREAGEAAEPAEPGRIRRYWRRGMAVAAALAIVALPGSQLAMRMVRDDKDPEPLDDLLDAETAEYVQANWERARDIDDIFVDDDLSLEDEDMESLVGALSVEGIPDRALDAYFLAEDNLAVDDPDCGVPWSLLAAIAEVESNHGYAQGSQLKENGDTTKPIRGIPLDGRPGVARITDKDGGKIDGDTTFERASGPFQFLPQSWRNVASDANGDNIENIDNIDDAATGAGVYLCAGGGNLADDPDDRHDAVFSYNRSEDYVRTVLSLAEMYEEGGVDDLAFEDSEGFEDDLGPEIDDDTAFEGQLGPEIEDEFDEPAPEPAPPAPVEVPTLESPPNNPGSVGWPTGMNELPPELLPPPVPLPGETTTTVPPTTTTPPPTTAPDCPADPAETETDTDASTTVPPTTVPPTTAPSTTVPDSTTTTTPPVDPECDPAESAGVDVADTADNADAASVLDVTAEAVAIEA